MPNDYGKFPAAMNLAVPFNQEQNYPGEAKCLSKRKTDVALGLVSSEISGLGRTNV